MSRKYACALVTVVRALAHYFHVFLFCSVKDFFYTHEINPFPIFMITDKYSERQNREEKTRKQAQT